MTPEAVKRIKAETSRADVEKCRKKCKKQGDFVQRINADRPSLEKCQNFTFVSQNAIVMINYEPGHEEEKS
jgi:riboflavin biosynthesis pyrimidine reductase